MLAYKYDVITGEYLNTQEAQLDPIEGNYLLPANVLLKYLLSLQIIK